MMNLLAETATSATLIPGEWVISLLVALVAAVGGVYLKRAGLAQGRREALEIGPQPFEVAVRENFVTRAECLACKNDSRDAVKEMKALFEKAVIMNERCLSLIQDRDDRWNARIDEVHGRITQEKEDGAERRRPIYDKLYEHEGQIGAIDARTDVSKAIGKLGAAIMTLAKKETN